MPAVGMDVGGIPSDWIVGLSGEEDQSRKEGTVGLLGLLIKRRM